VTGFELSDALGKQAVALFTFGNRLRGFGLLSVFPKESASGDLKEDRGRERVSLIFSAISSPGVVDISPHEIESSTSLILFSEGTLGNCRRILCDARKMMTMKRYGALWMIWIL